MGESAARGQEAGPSRSYCFVHRLLTDAGTALRTKHGTSAARKKAVAD
ncbi:helix-turn-helix domain-containing protein [Streptomyces canus]